jgi:hypothetical protein
VTLTQKLPNRNAGADERDAGGDEGMDGAQLPPRVGSGQAVQAGPHPHRHHHPLRGAGRGPEAARAGRGGLHPAHLPHQRVGARHSRGQAPASRLPQLLCPVGYLQTYVVVCVVRVS